MKRTIGGAALGLALAVQVTPAVAAGEIFLWGDWMWGLGRLSTRGAETSFVLSTHACHPWGVNELEMLDLDARMSSGTLTWSGGWGQLQGALFRESVLSAHLEWRPWPVLELMTGLGAYGLDIFGYPGTYRKLGTLGLEIGPRYLKLTLQMRNRVFDRESAIASMNAAWLDIRPGSRLATRLAVMHATGEAESLIVEQTYSLGTALALSLQYRTLANDWNIRIDGGTSHIRVDIIYSDHPLLGPAVIWGLAFLL